MPFESWIALGFTAFVLVVIVVLFFVLYFISKQARKGFERGSAQFGLPAAKDWSKLLSPEEKRRGERAFYAVVILSFLAGFLANLIFGILNRTSSLSTNLKESVAMGIFAWGFLGCIAALWKFRDALRIRGQTIQYFGPAPYGTGDSQVTMAILPWLFIASFFVLDLMTFEILDPGASLACSACGIGLVTNYIWHYRNHRLTDLGPYVEGKLYPWKIIEWYRWTENRKAIVFKCDVRLFFTSLLFVTVHTEDRELFDEILSRQLPGKQRAPLPPPIPLEPVEKLETNRANVEIES